MPYPELAGSTLSVRAAALQFFIGDAPIVTDSAPATVALKQWEIAVLTDAGLIKWDGAQADASGPNKLVVTMTAVPVGSMAPYYDAGKFNHEVMVWPAALDTYEKRKFAVLGSMVKIGHPVPKLP